MTKKELKPFFVLSRYEEDPSWIKEYTENYIIYNKGPALDDSFNTKSMPNIGGNQYDIAHFIYDNYDNLPEFMAFLQAFPWDHCNREKFDKIIYNEHFTSLESYEHLENTHAHIKDRDGGYMEINNSWYIPAHNRTYGLTCKYKSYHEFMQILFRNYDFPNYIRFAPGSQYLIAKNDALRHSKKFWKFIIDELPRNSMTEAHIVERSMLYILTGKYTVRNQFK
jgi:hypothetical protein